NQWKSNIYLKKRLSKNMILESLLFLYFGFAIYSAFLVNDFGLILFHLMLFAGFGFVAFKSIFSRI
ncbi:MAG TPA: glycosyl transferase family 2, partial [Leeuwenhoekiella sp.]|nr:glycosyl transferase family 2 [Leeuwenhoekiella sp.]